MCNESGGSEYVPVTNPNMYASSIGDHSMTSKYRLPSIPNSYNDEIILPDVNTNANKVGVSIVDMKPKLITNLPKF